MKLLKIVCGILLSVCIVLSAVFGTNYVKREIKTIPDYKGVISLWHIETFEGGFGSRKEFLLKTGARFEKLHQGVLVMVISHTVKSYNENIKKGIYPDLVSFGLGVEVKNQTEIKTETPFQYGLIYGAEYTSCWCMGGYFLIENSSASGNSIVVGENGNTSPLTALALSDFEVSSLERLNSFDAYNKFIAGKYKYFIGTQKEIYKLANRGFTFTAKPLEEYNDLFQYISVTSNSSDKRYYAEEYLKFLLSKDNQLKLNEIGLTSCFYKVDNENSYMQEFVNSTVKSAPSSFITPSEIQSLNELALKVIRKEESKIKIKNLLF